MRYLEAAAPLLPEVPLNVQEHHVPHMMSTVLKVKESVSKLMEPKLVLLAPFGMGVLSIVLPKLANLFMDRWMDGYMLICY